MSFKIKQTEAEAPSVTYLHKACASVNIWKHTTCLTQEIRRQTFLKAHLLTNTENSEHDLRLHTAEEIQN